MKLEREPENYYDRNAVRILTESGGMVGYIPRNKNASLANIIDNGVQVKAFVRYSSMDRVIIRVMMHTTDPMIRRHVSRNCMYCSEVAIDNYPVSRQNIHYESMSDSTRTIEYRNIIPNDLIWDLMWGHRALEMEDKWNMFYEDGALYFCRSWTGRCIYKLELDGSGNHLLTIETDQNIWNNSSDEDSAKIVNYLIDDYLVSYDIGHTQTPLNMCGNFYIGRDDGWTWEMDDDGRIVIKDPEYKCTGPFTMVEK